MRGLNVTETTGSGHCLDKKGDKTGKLRTVRVFRCFCLSVCLVVQIRDVGKIRDNVIMEIYHYKEF